MATSLNSGYTNNVNTIQIRVNGAHMHRVTDRALTNPVAAARTIVSEVTETDGGLSKDFGISEFTEGA